MTRHVVFVAPEDKLYSAFASMRRMGARHIPVLDGRELVGILSDRDILRHGIVRNDEVVIGSMAVAAVMTKSAWTCYETDRVGDVADLMLRHHVDAIPVLDSSGKLSGIITSTDLLRLLRRLEGVLDVGAAVESRISDD